MKTLRATMRLQFHEGFKFDAAVRILPYLAALHVSHLYASPILTARSGSMHGYDVIDPTQVNPELGGEPAFRRLVAALREVGLGIIVDIVPNHMAIGNDNPWWMDLLNLGRKSRYARYFDIDWNPSDPAIHGKVLAPVLGRPYGEALARREIALTYNASADRYEARYFDHVFPIAPDLRADIERRTLDAFDPRTATGKDQLHALLERQNFHLAWWRSANDNINWRRFFDINGLVALRVEDEDVFEATHLKLFQLFADGLIDGVRVDHVDGLTDPKEYCRRLRMRLAALADARPQDIRGQLYIVVEKILGAGEELAADWECDGTSGYDFMDQVSSVLHDPAGEVPLGRLWSSISGRPMEFATEEVTARREMLDRSFTAQLTALVHVLHQMAATDLSTRDLSRASIWRSLVEILAGMRVYRTYRGEAADSKINDAPLVAAVERARHTCLRTDRDTVDWLSLRLAGVVRAETGSRNLDDGATRRFRQLSAPLAAKAVEDTAFYRYGRLLSRVDVGFDAGRFAYSTATFHRKSLQRHRTFPSGMLATATHDHKRGEDVRARLAVLSELSSEWAGQLERWMRLTASLRSNSRSAVSAGDVAILFQTIVGAWPPMLSVSDLSECAAYAERLSNWQQKAMREAKLVTEWTVPDDAYESAAREFLAAIFAGPPSALLGEIEAFAHRISAAGAVNGLSQVLTKLTSPGVPDLYQGTEFWDLSLVDPDNRRPVDFAFRMEALSTDTHIHDLAKNWQDGRIKQAIIQRSLAFRRAHPALFSHGHYLPIAVQGPAADHVIAFARVHRREAAITVVTRFATRLLPTGGGILIPQMAWAGTKLSVPDQIGPCFRDALTGAKIMAAENSIPLPLALNPTFPTGAPILEFRRRKLNLFKGR
jgi:(1->4)-alpha-D-glucan 1-alpha-D-glucosylmutase